VAPLSKRVEGEDRQRKARFVVTIWRKTEPKRAHVRRSKGQLRRTVSCKNIIKDGVTVVEGKKEKLEKVWSRE